MAAEKFDYQGVKTKMGELEDLFEKFAKKLTDINMYLNENVNVGPGSAIFGEAGSGVLNAWNENAATFGDFKANFDKWSQLVAIVQMNNMELEGENFRSTGGTLSGVQASRDAIAKDMSDDLINKSMYVEGDYRYVTVVTNQGTVITKYDMSGKPVEVVTTSLDANGNTIKVIASGTIMTTYVIGAGGKILSRTSENQSGYKMIVDENNNISFVDYNGKPISDQEYYNARGNYHKESFIAHVPNYSSDSSATTYTSSLVGNIEGTANSVVMTGASFTMSKGSEVIGKDGNNYYFMGMATEGRLAGVKYFSNVDPSSGYTSNAQLFIIDDFGNVTPTNLGVGMLSSNTDANIVTTVRIVNKELNVSNLVINNNTDSWAVSRSYIADQDGYQHLVSETEQLAGIFNNRQSFTISGSKTMYETDWDNSVSHSDIFYNTTNDSGQVSNNYYHNANNDAYISSYELWEGNGTQEAFQKAIERGDNMKNGLRSGDPIFELHNKQSGSSGYGTN